MGSLINVIEVVLVWKGKKEKHETRELEEVCTVAVFCDSACFHEAKIIYLTKLMKTQKYVTFTLYFRELLLEAFKKITVLFAK